MYVASSKFAQVVKFLAILSLLLMTIAVIG
jgi:hypothetical protein